MATSKILKHDKKESLYRRIFNNRLKKGGRGGWGQRHSRDKRGLSREPEDDGAEEEGKKVSQNSKASQKFA